MGTFKPDVLQPGKDVPRLLDCGHPPSGQDKFVLGYGVGPDRKTFCHACCAEHDKNAMVREGRATLYLVRNHAVRDNHDSGYYEVVNWPGSLKFPVYYYSVGAHNISGERVDVWFHGPDGFVWHGRQYGHMSDVCRCTRTKKVSHG